MHIHARLVVTNLSPPSGNILNVDIVGNTLAVHNVVEGRHRSTLCVQLSVPGWTCKTLFHSALETLACGCVFRHGCSVERKRICLVVNSW